MGLLSKEKQQIENDFFKVWDVVDLLGEKAEKNWLEVASFLGHYEFATKISLFEKDRFYRIFEVNNNFAPIRNLIDELQHAWLEEDGFLEKLKRQYSNYYWCKDDIYNFKPIMDLGIIEYPSQVSNVPKFQNDSLEKNIDVNIANLELDIAIEKAKVKELETENEILKKELLDLKNNSEKNNLDLIFDENAIEQYAPDLVYAIRLWVSVYIDNPKTDSHTNKANTWLKNNTGYDVTKQNSSASKIREITSPLKYWSTHRDKKFKKQS